jgi:DNA-binding transcriptional MocR family regulator
LLGSLYLQRGDTVLIEDPTYFGAVDAFRAAGARLSSLPVGKEGVSPTILRERISSTAARLVIPHSDISESQWLSDARSGTKSYCKDCD